MKLLMGLTPRNVEQIVALLPDLVAGLRPKYPRDAETQERITVEQIYVLDQLDPRIPITVTGLARKLEISVPAASMAITRLARRGYVDKQRDPADRRRKLLLITPRGMVARRAGLVPVPSMVKRALERIHPAERNLAVRGLDQLMRGAVMGRGQPDPWGNSKGDWKTPGYRRLRL